MYHFNQFTNTPTTRVLYREGGQDNAGAQAAREAAVKKPPEATIWDDENFRGVALEAADIRHAKGTPRAADAFRLDKRKITTGDDRKMRELLEQLGMDQDKKTVTPRMARTSEKKHAPQVTSAALPRRSFADRLKFWKK